MDTSLVHRRQLPCVNWHGYDVYVLSMFHAHHFQATGISRDTILTTFTDTVSSTTPNANIYGYNILVGTGMGCYIVAGFAIVQSLVPAHDIANAVGAMTICQYLSTLFGAET